MTPAEFAMLRPPQRRAHCAKAIELQVRSRPPAFSAARDASQPHAANCRAGVQWECRLQLFRPNPSRFMPV
jgi:hypothetical protein